MQVVYLSGIGFSTVGLARRSNHQRKTWRDTKDIEDLLARHTVVNLLTLYVRLCSTLFSERELDVNLREVHFFAIMVGWV